MVEQRPTLGIIGAGKVGCTLARLLYRAGYTFPAVYSRTVDHAHQLAEQVGGQAVLTPDAVIAQADLTLLTVPDDVIGSTASEITLHDIAGKALVHTSGVHGRGILDSVTRRGAMTGSLHPAFPFADAETALVGLPGATFALEFADELLERWLYAIVGALEGRGITIPPGGKATYHLALALASNFTVTLYAVAERLLLSLGTERGAADNALQALLAGTVDNLHRQGIPQALTGPLTRADTGTIAAHLAVLQQGDPTLLAVYKGLARLSYPMLEAREVPVAPIERILQQEN